MMRALVAVLVGTAAAFAAPLAELPLRVEHTLTTIDVVPTKAQLDSAFASADEAKTTLAEIATSEGDIGIRLRAIHALSKYCTAPCAAADLAHQSLTTLIAQTQTELSGGPVLLLRAAVETIGVMRVAADVNILLPLLDHPSRDIRASTARALQDLCNAQAITPLRVRYSRELTDQVKLAISEALRILGQCTATQ